MLKQRLTQSQRLIKALAFKPLTMLAAARLIRVERSSVCSLIAELQRAGKVVLIKRDICRITKFKAGHYSSNSKFLKQ